MSHPKASHYNDMKKQPYYAEAAIEAKKGIKERASGTNKDMNTQTIQESPWKELKYQKGSEQNLKFIGTDNTPISQQLKLQEALIAENIEYKIIQRPRTGKWGLVVEGDNLKKLNSLLIAPNLDDIGNPQKTKTMKLSATGARFGNAATGIVGTVGLGVLAVTMTSEAHAAQRDMADQLLPPDVAEEYKRLNERHEYLFNRNAANPILRRF